MLGNSLYVFMVFRYVLLDWYKDQHLKYKYSLVNLLNMYIHVRVRTLFLRIWSVLQGLECQYTCITYVVTCASTGPNCPDYWL